jgi:hypothetical protein
MKKECGRMKWVGEVFDGLGVTGRDREPAFPDGAAFRIEIPSVERPRVLEAVLRATEEGIRSFLVADLGLLRAVTQAQVQGALPAGLVWKVSASMSPTNPVTLKVLEEMGASTVNIPADVTLDELAEMRATVKLPLDLYVESPDALAGVVRGQELGDLVRAGAPLYAKFGLRNAQAIYPSGHHLEAVACANAIEKVHRAAVALEWLERLSPGLVQSKPGAAGLGLPVR